MQVDFGPMSLISIAPGHRLHTNTSQFPFSMGYRARRNGVNGVVTTGHAGGIFNGVAIWNGLPNRQNIIGNVEAFQLNDVDASFVRLMTSATATTQLTGHGNHTPSVHNPRLGDVVTHIGTGSGTLRSSQHTVIHTGRFFEGSGGTVWGIEAVLTSGNPIVNGDSGGIVFHHSTRSVSGIIMGSMSDFMIYSPASRINAALGLQMH